MRKWIAEPPNGGIKNVLGFRRSSLRGLHRKRAEWKLGIRPAKSSWIPRDDWGGASEPPQAQAHSGQP